MKLTMKYYYYYIPSKLSTNDISLIQSLLINAEPITKYKIQQDATSIVVITRLRSVQRIKRWIDCDVVKIVSFEWIEECKRRGKMIDYEGYRVSGSIERSDGIERSEMSGGIERSEMSGGSGSSGSGSSGSGSGKSEMSGTTSTTNNPTTTTTTTTTNNPTTPTNNNYNLTSFDTTTIPKYECFRFTPLLSKSNPNYSLIKQLQVITHQRELINDPHTLSLQRALATLLYLPIKYDESMSLVNIGPKIRRIISSSSCSYSTTAMTTTLQLFQSIYGVGYKHAMEWYRRGFRCINDIPERELNEHQKYWINHMPQPLTREEIKDIHSIISSSYSSSNVVVVGGYRRGKEINNDMDVIVVDKGGSSIERSERSGGSGSSEMSGTTSATTTTTTTTTSATTTHLTPFDTTTHLTSFDTIHQLSHNTFIAKYNSKYFQLDLITANNNEYPYKLLAWTGSKMFVRSMRLYASTLGYKLTQDTMYDSNGYEVVVRNEREIFNILNMEYIPPEGRNC